MLREGRQQIELAARQCHLVTERRNQAACRGVELPARETVSARCAGGGRGGRSGRSDPAQDGVDARQQLAQVERLGDVVVGTDLEADDLVDGVASPGDDDQPAMPMLAQLARDREPVFARQAEVEQDQRRRIDGHELQQGTAVMHLRHAIAAALQVAGEQLRDLHLVVEDGDVLGGVQCGDAATGSSPGRPSVSAFDRTKPAPRVAQPGDR